MELFIIFIAAVALGGSLFLMVRVRRLNAGLKRISDSHARAVRKMEFIEDTLAGDIAKLKFDLKNYHGDLTFKSDMTFRQALAVNPKVQNVMNEMHVGGCPDCRVELDQTLAQGATVNSVSPEAFLVRLNNLEAPVSQPKQPAVDSELKLL